VFSVSFVPIRSTPLAQILCILFALIVPSLLTSFLLVCTVAFPFSYFLSLRVFACPLSLVCCQFRGVIRMVLKIPGSAFDDCLVSCLCQPCVVTQMVRKTPTHKYENVQVLFQVQEQCVPSFRLRIPFPYLISRFLRFQIFEL
jgi:Cys-rich protein (TIGR01571 family)